MSIGEICTREVVVTPPSTNVEAAAELMRHHHVGDLIVVEKRGEERIPVGIVTDRDIVVEVVAAGLDPKSLTVGEIMCQELVTGREEDGILDTLQIMRTRGVRRLPILNADGSLLGIVTVDDLIEVFAEELTDLARVISRGRAREATVRS
ncbi:MAG: CBS domain-containing protein [Burkholderiales bacterium]